MNLNYERYLGYVDFAKSAKSWEDFMSEYGYPADCPYDAEGLIQMCQIVFAVSRQDCKELVKLSQMSGAALARKYNIPCKTLDNWLSPGTQKRTAPKYVTELIGYAMIAEIPQEGEE